MRRYPVFRLSFILSVSLLLTGLWGCASKEEKVAKHLQRAEQYAEKNELAKAVVELRIVVQLEPQNDKAWFELGETYLKLNQAGEAFQAFSRAASINPDNLKAQVRLGRIFLLGKRVPEARKRAEFVLEKSVSDVDALMLLSSIQVQENDAQGAIETLVKTLAIDSKNFNACLSLARLLARKDEYKRAETAYRQAMTISPNINVPYIELSRLFVNRAQTAEAETILTDMIVTAGASEQNLQVLASFYETTGQMEKAERVLRRSVDERQRESVSPLMSLAGFYSRRGSYEQALEAMNRALQVKKGDLEILTNLAKLHLDFNRVDKADALVCQTLDLDKGHLDANFIKGRIHLVRGEYPQALEKFNFLAQERPRSDSVYYYRALARMGSGEGKFAEQDLLKAVELNPRSVNPRILLAEKYLRERERMLARQQVEAILKLAPRDKRGITLAGGLKLLEQDLKGAEEMFKKLVQLYPRDGSSHLRLGAYYSLRGKEEEAEARFKKALELEPESREALAVTTGNYLMRKKYDAALQTCEIQKSRIGNNPRALAFVSYSEGCACLAKEERAKALSHFAKAIDLDPNLLDAYERIARIHLAENRLARARDEYQKIISKNPGYVAGYMALGAINDRMGRRDEAAVNYRSALRIDQNFAPAANNLAWNLIECGGNTDEALSFAQTAKQGMPKSPIVMDTLGWIYSLKGSYLNAIAELDDAIRLDGGNPLINYHLGMVWYKYGQPQKAIEFLEKALAADQGFSEAEDARRVLKEIQEKG